MWCDLAPRTILIEVLGTIAEQERHTIRKRQREGIDAAIAKGKHMGRPKLVQGDDWPKILSDWKNKKITARRAIEELGISKSAFYNLVKES